jgi:hypothetical protein
VLPPSPGPAPLLPLPLLLDPLPPPEPLLLDPLLDPLLEPPPGEGASPKKLATYATAQVFSSTKYVLAVPHPLAVSMDTAWLMPVIE